jgi:hypothetical protein
MAYDVRDIPTELVYALVTAWNEYLALDVGSNFHYDVTSRMTSTDYRNPTRESNLIEGDDCTDTATAIVLVNEIWQKLNVHFADTMAHASAVSAAIGTATATTLATAITRAEAIRTAYTAHLSASNVHATNDSTNTITAATATNEATLVTLVNELKEEHDDHIEGAPQGRMIRIIGA